ncbi:MAG: hypothetical protein Q9183_003379 [Haloplaca sp. 2 TL-2023]
MGAAPMLNTPAPTHGFARLPREVNQHIASYVNFNDLKSLALVQHATADAVLPANAGHWRIRYRSQFELPVHKDNASIKKDYILSKMFLNSSVYFRGGHSVEEQACLRVIRQLIQECSYTSSDTAPKNLQQIWRFLKKSNFLFDACRWSYAMGGEHDQTNELLATVRLFFFSETIMLTNVQSLDAAYPWPLRQTVYGIRKSQDYLLQNVYKPIVKPYGELDREYLSHLTNFWKFHLGVCKDSTAKQLYESCTEEEQIAPWAPTKSRTGLRLGNKWKGTIFNPYRYEREDYKHSGQTTIRGVFILGFLVGDDGFLDLNLSEPADKNLKWPMAFKKLTPGLPEDIKGLASAISRDRCALCKLKTSPSDKVSRQKSTKAAAELQSGVDCYHKPAATAQSSIVIGHGEFHSEVPLVHYAGILHELPAQSGIGGFQRLTMVCYMEPESGTHENGYLDGKTEDFQILMTYESIVLPCGNVILGRYHFDRSFRQSFKKTMHGPFIYWNQDDESPDNARRAFFDDRAGSSEETRREELSQGQEWLAKMQKTHQGN